MQRTGGVAIALLLLASAAAAQTRLIPREADVHFSEQIANGPAGNCGCFTMEGAAGDFAWTLYHSGIERVTTLSAVADVSVEHTGNVNGAPFGLTLTSVVFGPRVAVPARKSSLFAQSLIGFTHGSGSEFPQGGNLVSSANSFAFDLGAGADYPLTRRIALRIAQVEYLRTSLPNNASGWQNNLRLSAGITMRIR
jgi:outer membrane immunogenic protein